MVLDPHRRPVAALAPTVSVGEVSSFVHNCEMNTPPRRQTPPSASRTKGRAAGATTLPAPPSPPAASAQPVLPVSPIPPVPPVAPLKAPRQARLRKQEQILLEAERQFARYGFEGVSLDDIASALGVSRQNMLYYYSSKEALYGAVLDDVMASWESMDTMDRDGDLEAAVGSYIGSKLRFSQERPSGSAVFTREIMAGAPRYAETLAARVTPKLRADVKTFERWAKQGLIQRLDFTHLIFVIWAATQAYADLAPQFALLMGKQKLDAGDFAAAQATITSLVIQGLQK
jgi:TetR/AcrR family transcriptional regulator